MRARPELVNKIEFPAVEKSEQKRIAAILDKADAILRKRQQAIHLADEFLRSVFFEMFGDPRNNPKGWDVVRLGDWADVITGYPFSSTDYRTEPDSSVKLCRGANVLPRRLDWSDVVYWPEDEVGPVESYLLEKGDVVLALDRPWISSGLKVVVFGESEPALLVQRVARIRPRTISESHYFYQMLLSPHFLAHCRPTETTVPHISPVELKHFPVPKPPSELLENYGAVVEKTVAMTERLRQGALDSEQFFGAVSQRAFQGGL